jgi:hypothetical protein
MSTLDLHTVSPKNIKIGVFGVELEVPTSGLSEWAKKLGRTTVGANVVRHVTQWQTDYATQRAWNELGELGKFMDVTLRNYLHQGAISKAALERLNDVLEWDKTNPPASPFPNTFILPAERRLQYAWGALEEEAEKTSPVKSFGGYLSENPDLRDAMLYQASRVWERIEKVRGLVLSHAKAFAKEGETVDETQAWEILAPEAMQLAKRFMMMTDHPWSRMNAYKQDGTIFAHALRKDAWLKEEWRIAFKRVSPSAMDFSFQDSTTSAEVAKWSMYCGRFQEGKRLLALKSELGAWNNPHAVAMALATRGTPAELKEWLDVVKEQQAEKGKAFDINLQHFALNGQTLMDHVLLNAKREHKKEMAEGLLARGGTMDAFARTGMTEYELVMSSTLTTSVEQATDWVNWLKAKSTHPNLSFNENGQTEVLTALNSNKIEWAAALLALRKDPGDSMSMDGKTWSDHWKSFKAQNAHWVREWSETKPNALKALNSSAPEDEVTALFERQPPDFWEKIDRRLEQFGSLPPPAPIKRPHP